jgi:hypothetical protein
MSRVGDGMRWLPGSVHRPKNRQCESAAKRLEHPLQHLAFPLFGADHPPHAPGVVAAAARFVGRHDGLVLGDPVVDLLTPTVEKMLVILGLALIGGRPSLVASDHRFIHRHNLTDNRSARAQFKNRRFALR